MLRDLGGVSDDRMCPDYIRNTLTVLQEYPLKFSRLHEELTDEWQPSTPTLRKLVLRLAYLMWRQERAERAQDGVMLCRMEREVTERHQRMLESASASPARLRMKAGCARRHPPPPSASNCRIGCSF